MSSARILALTSLTMIAFACNSLLCRLALLYTPVDPGSFATIRLISGAATLWLIVRIRRGSGDVGGNWPSAVALFVYAAAFSFAYVSLSAATGALLLFGAVQVTMICYGLWKGERLRGMQMLGFALAVGGLIGLLAPGLSAPPLIGSLLMFSAGVAWGVYSLRGKAAGDPLIANAGNFLRTVPIAVVLSLIASEGVTLDSAGVSYAVLSGAVASGVGYAIWYAVLPFLRVTQAAGVQLSVPVIAALGGIAFLDESITLRFVLASLAVLGGIALVVSERQRHQAA